MKKSIFLVSVCIYCFILLAIEVKAQVSIKGQIIDAITKQPIEAAQLLIQDSVLVATSDNSGRFNIISDKPITAILIMYTGYFSQVVQIVNNQPFLTIAMQPQLRLLEEVVVTGYGNNRKLIETSGAIAVLNTADLQRFNNTSILPAVNTIPGVRMEERSPGSYRLSIRGSLIRAPFGVRNVKVYWNDIPFTDPGGNSAINLLDFNSIGRMEIIKGPAGSIYGAGTGGVVLLQSTATDETKAGVQISALAGSYGLRGIQTNIQTGGQSPVLAGYSHLESNGYRQQSGMQRDMFHFYSQPVRTDKRTINLTGFYSDLYYQTPGGITLAQMQENPRLARPSTATIRGSVEQRAAIYNKTFFAGASQQYQWSNNFSNATSVYGTFSQFENPFITNYERRAEHSFGGRTRFTYGNSLGSINSKFTAGAEFQTYFASDRVYGNNYGNPDTLQVDDEIGAMQYLFFGQAEFELPSQIIVTAGASYNRLQYRLLRLSGTPPNEPQTRNFTPVVSPRISLLKNWNDRIALHGSVSFGYSPPSVTEVRPSEATFNIGLKPEIGVNYEAGVRGNLFSNRYSFDFTAFSLQLQETIVRRTNDTGAEFFVNAGGTSQNGLEIANAFTVISAPKNAVSLLKFILNYTYTNFTFKNYQQNTDDFSGKKIAGVAPHIVVAGIDAQLKLGFYTNITATYTDFIPLNDANTVQAKPYGLLNGRLGWKKQLNPLLIDIYGGIDNGLNETYSLGNDLNAFGGRYFNPAAARNYYGGISIKYLFHPKKS